MNCDLLEVYRRACFARAFELRVKEAYDAGRIKIPVYLCVGQELIGAALSVVLDGFSYFAQHRAHGLYLSLGGSPEALRDELLGLPTGCSRSWSGSNAIQWPGAQMFGHSGLLGEQVAIATGYALASGHPTLTVFGDAAVEEDYFAPALGFAATHQLPMLFVCEDNDRSILTPKSVRRSWSLSDIFYEPGIASGYGLTALRCSDDPVELIECLRNVVLPAVINVKTCRHLWHAGTGNDGAPEVDRLLELTRRIGDEAHDIAMSEYLQAREIWAQK